MKQEEIEQAAGEYASKIESEHPDIHPKTASFQGYYDGYTDCNKHWEEKTRWKSLEKEPPTEFGESKRVLIKHRDLEIAVYFLYSERSVEDALDMGFIEWKEID